MWMLGASAIGWTDLKGGAGAEGSPTDIGVGQFLKRSYK